MINLDRLNSLIKEKGITKAFIANKLGKSRSLLTDWANNKSTPSAADLEVVANLLDVSIDYLLGKTDIKKEPTAEIGDKLEGVEAEVIKLFRAASPEMKAAALAVLEAAERAQVNKDASAKD